MKIKHINLLTSDQVRDNTDILPDDPHRWWCYTKGWQNAGIVYPGFEIETIATTTQSCYIRPAMVLEDVQTSRGEILNILYEDWIVLEAYENGAVVACTRTVGKGKFDYFKERAKHYKRSRVKRWLQRWLLVRMPLWNKPIQWLLSTYNKIKMKYTKAIAISQLVVPLLLIGGFAWFMLATFTPGPVAKFVMDIIGYVLTALGCKSFASCVQRILNPQWTLIGHLVNLAMVVLVFATGLLQQEFFGFVISGCAIPAHFVIHKAMDEFEY